jgi:hypothetical protein
MSAPDVQADAAAPNRVEFRGNESRWEALFYLGFGGVIVTYLVSKGGWTAIIGSAIFGSLFLLVAFGKAFGELDRSIYLAFDEEGLAAPHLFARKVPWSAIRTFSFDAGMESGTSLLVDVIEPTLFGPKVTNPWKASRVGRSGFRLSLDRVACRDEEIELAFRRFAPQVRKVQS